MKWLQLSVRTTPEFVEPVSELLRRYGERDVIVQEEGDWDPDNAGEMAPPTSVVVMTCLPMDSTTSNRREMIDVGIRLITILEPGASLEDRVVDEDEWETAWKSRFTVKHIGKRLVLKPTWQIYWPAPGDVVIELDPGMAFGTGHHPTTRMCLEQLERLLVPGMRVLDLGTGSGILAIAAIKLGADCVVGLDTDETAVQVARANIEQNGVLRVRLIHGSLPHSTVQDGEYDLALANVTAGVVASYAGSLARALRGDGLLIASGILEERWEEVEATLGESFVVEQSLTDGDWLTVVARKPGLPSQQAYSRDHKVDA